MINDWELRAGVPAPSLERRAVGQIASGIDAETAAAELNQLFLDAGGRPWQDHAKGHRAAEFLIARFVETGAALERCGWTAGRIRESIVPSRQVLATSPFIRRCQEWPRGYAGDFETVEYMMA